MFKRITRQTAKEWMATGRTDDQLYYFDKRTRGLVKWTPDDRIGINEVDWWLFVHDQLMDWVRYRC